ncbi:MAG: response regulator transcription factor [Ignavibacteria bacterium]|nr:response regulator transcription factor [Ignavibacteria bacterium]MBL7991970.1 response regulator transcription factor [Candidatus Kapabacteria bacterium]
MNRILLIEDETQVAAFIKQGLSEQSFVVDVATTGAEGEQMMREKEYDALIVDVMLPRKSGFAVCRSLRTYNTTLPILMLTALDSIEDKTEGFRAGADDYLVKPFDFRELLLRLQALLRRHSSIEQGNILTLADLQIDTDAKRVTRAGRGIELTAREYSLLEYLMRNQRRIVSRYDIAENVWNNEQSATSNTIEVFITFLRRKIDKEFSPKLIHTVVGMGYIMKDDKSL